MSCSIQTALNDSAEASVVYEKLLVTIEALEAARVRRSKSEIQTLVSAVAARLEDLAMILNLEFGKHGGEKVTAEQLEEFVDAQRMLVLVG